MLKVGYFEFTIDGQTRRLQAYKSVPMAGEREDESLFVPFRDSTGGKESYPAGRYLDLPVTKNDEYVLDFNLAYNPYCAYNDAYICPLPPRENWLDTRIEAGEELPTRGAEGPAREGREAPRAPPSLRRALRRIRAPRASRDGGPASR